MVTKMMLLRMLIEITVENNLENAFWPILFKYGMCSVLFRKKLAKSVADDSGQLEEDGLN